MRKSPPRQTASVTTEVLRVAVALVEALSRVKMWADMVLRKWKGVTAELTGVEGIETGML